MQINNGKREMNMNKYWQKKSKVIQIKEQKTDVRYWKKELFSYQRLIIVKCLSNLWNIVFDNTKNLKDVTDEARNPYFVKPQLPEPLLTEESEWEVFRSVVMIPCMTF